MTLVGITVKDFRSITSTRKLQLGQSTILIGRNNEGKSNILRALVLGLSTLLRGHPWIGRGYNETYRSLTRAADIRDASTYQWENDYPIDLQKSAPNGSSEITLDFKLDAQDLTAFQKTVGSSLNGLLPIRIACGPRGARITVAKQGRGASTLTSKAAVIAEFIRKRIDFQYIPTVRTAQRANDVVDEMVGTALRAVESHAKYKAALKTISEVQKPVLDEISASIKKTLVQFLPAIKDVKVRIGTEERTRALRMSSEILINDGSPTPLKRKGDGVQSLAAIALMRHAASANASSKHTIIAIEEPESHLHPHAIHELRDVLQEIAKTQQIVLTTHCPLFVDRTQISANIIVDSSKARSAVSTSEIRQILGIRASDNLQHAELALVVEGTDDALAIDALLRHYSTRVAKSLDHRTFIITPLDGATNLPYKVRLLHDSLCQYHCYLDNDDAGRKGFEDARKSGLLSDSQCNFTTCSGMLNSEMEDLIDLELYRDAVQQRYSIRLDVPMIRSNKKWSDRMREAFTAQGKQWNDRVKMQVKLIVAQTVADNPGIALNHHRRGSFDGLIHALELRLQSL